MRGISLDTFLNELKAQDVPSKEHFVFKCPVCGTHQSAQDLINAGAGKTFEDVEKYLGFSCVGRWTDAGSHEGPKDANGVGCNWTLGGLFRIHELEVTDPDGVAHPQFEVCTKNEAHDHYKRNRIGGDK